jgi:hypothetical protein
LSPDTLSSSAPDCVYAALTAEGIILAEERLFEHSALFAGYRFEIAQAEIVYRMHDPQTVVIIRYRTHPHDRKNLANPFRGMHWFLQFLCRSELGVKRVMGLVDTTLYQEQGGLTAERLLHVYQHHMGGRLIDFDGARWVYQDLVDYRSPRR